MPVKLKCIVNFNDYSTKGGIAYINRQKNYQKKDSQKLWPS